MFKIETQDWKTAKHSTCPNARFWIHAGADNGWVKVVLRPGQTLAQADGGRHEEGWSREYERWTHEGDQVEYEFFQEGRDCDGRYERSVESACPLGNLRSVALEDILTPEWEEADVSQRDYAAEAAGY